MLRFSYLDSAAISPLQYFIHDDWDAVRIEMAGALSGADARNAYQQSRTAMRFVRERPLVVDITFVAEADDTGRAVLRAWRRLQARIVARSPESRAIAEAIVRTPADEPAPRPGWLRRIARLPGPPVSRHGAGIPSKADGGGEARASAPEESVAIKQVVSAGLVARKLR